jgi:DNA-binding winged helix-turn-helix (wHTH) protein/tetratricopeptide (TPR) repeat protein
MPIFSFDDCELDTAQRELRKAGCAVHLQPQVFGVLGHLVENRHRAVSKEELRDAVWGTRYVGDSALASRIKAARQAIGDDGRDQRVIRTIHGYGYRFVADVTERSDVRSPEVATGVPLVERAHELEVLQRALDHARRGEGRVVLVVGEPGIGKTALVRAFIRAASPPSRFLMGACEALITPRPFGPLHDVGRRVPAVAAAITDRVSPSTLQRVVLDELEAEPSPVVLVLEDVHWADEATLDLLAFLVRRVPDTPSMLLLTYRDTELDASHPLLGVVGSLRSEIAREIRPLPLSRAGVASLVGEDRADRLMLVTRGNPFYVTELAAADGDAVPRSISHAVSARFARFPRATRELLGLLAVAPSRLEVSVLESLEPDWAEAIEPAEIGGLVILEGDDLRFRHELARQAVLDSLPTVLRRRHHGALLRVLLDRRASPARIVHHADGAGDHDTLATYALSAARDAAGTAAHRESHSQYLRVVRNLDRFGPGERARIFEEASREAYLTAAEDDALEWADAALRGFQDLGDQLGVGRVLRWISRLHWFAVRGDEADTAARRAIEVLEPLGPSTELAWAYSNRSQLAMLAYDDDEAVRWAGKAAELADHLGAVEVKAHALVNMGMVAIGRDVLDDEVLLAAVELADRAGEHHEATRGLLGLSYTLMTANRLERAREVGERALAYSEQHEVDALTHYIVAMLAQMDVRAGRWQGLDQRLEPVIDEGGPVAKLLALSTFALLQVRRGDPEAESTLAQAWELAIPAGELQRLAPLAVAEAERAWLADSLSPESPHLRTCFDEMAVRQPAMAGELARWLAASGVPVHEPPDVDEPHRLELAGNWTAAAAMWAERGMPYDQALCLAGSGRDIPGALALAAELGARPLVAWCERRLSERRLSERAPD